MVQSNNTISTVERRRIIMDEIHLHKQIDIQKLNEMFDVSEVTLRKDLHYLENKNLIVRSRGGAMLAIKVADDLSVKERMILNLDKKKCVAKAASKLIMQTDTIIIGSGTTLMLMLDFIDKNKELTAITNALDIASKLSEYENVKIIMPGGIFRKKSNSLVGILAAENFKLFRADKYFVSCDGIGADGLFTSNIDEGQIAKIIMSNAKENIVLVDSSKFDKTGIINFASLQKISTIVTDQNVPENFLKIFAENGIKVIIS